MKQNVKTLLNFFSLILVLFLYISPALGEAPPNCVEGFQDTGSIYRICMPGGGIPYNGRLVVWAHGFQDAGPGVEIPEGQLCFDNICIDELVNSIGCAFATNSYSKKGLAVKQGMADIIDLVDIFEDEYEEPESVYLIGASEGGLITALLAEQRPDLFEAGFALCGPIGDFPYQINYLGDARVTFEYFFPDEVPGYGVFNSIHRVGGRYIRAKNWESYFTRKIGPMLANHPREFEQWARVAKLPYDPNDYFNTILFSAQEVLRFSVIYPNLNDARRVLRGLPFNNRWKWYTGSNNDFRLNLRVKRLSPTGDAVDEMQTFYNTNGQLDIPLITEHTRQDPQVPYCHETIYSLKTIASGSFLKDHFNIPVDRYGHCSFTLEEALGGFALMLIYAGDWELLAALESLTAP
jgi:pimeloyl-ACP methyl ester carboxylesterase